MNTLASMFCLGVYTLLAQMIITRELAILCLGNELIIGVVFSSWLLLIGAGARGVRSPHGPDRNLEPGLIAELEIRHEGPVPKPDTPHVSLVAAFLFLAAALPMVLLGLRLAAGVVRPTGDMVSLSRVFLVTLLAFAPICLPAGGVFPAACQAMSRRRGQNAVRTVYAVEAFGSFAAGVVFSFCLIGRFNALQIVGMAMAASLAGAACLTGAGTWRRGLASGAIVLLLCSVHPGLLSRINWRTAEWRWSAMGVTCDGAAGRSVAVLRGGADTRYQNLALIESGGLWTLYSDGQVMFSFPDEITSERTVRFVLAQHPGAKRVLLLGGNPAGELPCLLNLPVDEVVWVERDNAVRALVLSSVSGLSEKLNRESRLKMVCDDGPRFVKQCRSTFDVVLVHVPEPVSTGLNRYFTREFYGDVRRILSPGGFMHTAVEGTEYLGEDSARMAGSIDRTLREVFPVVQVTGGTPIQFFASEKDGPLSLSRETLYRRGRSLPGPCQSFNPVYFLSAEELDPEKIEFTRQRLLSAAAPVNTIMRPATWRYSLILWDRYSDSRIGGLLGRMERMRPDTLAGCLAAFGAIAWLGILILGRRAGRRVARVMACQVMAVTGFCGVALELILLYAYQGFHGYVYDRMSFMVGLFMLGTVAGAGSARYGAGGLARTAVSRGLVAMMAVVLATWWSLTRGIPPEWLLYGLTAAAGAVAGMQFVTVTRALEQMGMPEVRAAGRTWFWDYWGSATGGVLAGVLLPAVFGIPATCLLLAVLLVLCLLLFIAVPAPPRLPGAS